MKRQVVKPALPASIMGRSGWIQLERDTQGVAHITASDLYDALMGLGFCHAYDRGTQMLLVRILGQGRACEQLRDSPALLNSDRFFRLWNLSADVAREEAALSDRARLAIQAYCEGANLCYSGRPPWELRLLGCRFEPWTAADVFLTAKVTGLITLAQSQGEMEQFIVECVRHGISREKLEELFPGQLEGLDEELIRRVQLPEPLIPESVKWAPALSRMMASNNWVVAGAKTASGQPILCNDPHLELNRLPPVWYEAVLRWPAENPVNYAMGATLPGTPGVSVGRNRDLAWGVTYAFMDCVDSWIEDCRGGEYRRGDSWLPFTRRVEVIRRKHHPQAEFVFYENNHGVLNGDAHKPGYYLTSRWSCGDETSAASLDAACGILTAKTVEEGRTLLGRLSNSAWNWVLADRSGNIGYQMSGKLPCRRPGFSGLVPLPGWDPANDWQGFYCPEDLPRDLNPPAGFIVTANQDLNHLGKAHPHNLPMASYRADRITEVLSEPGPVGMETMRQLQLDLFSTQAERFMSVIRPLLSELSPAYAQTITLLKNWDLTYHTQSYGAFLFEQIYLELFHEVFGNSTAAFGGAVAEHLVNETCLFCDFYGNFDRVLLSEQSIWFGPRSRTEVFRAALGRALPVSPEAYGRRRKLHLRHLLFGGKMARFLGLEPVLELPGSRATVHQGQIYRTAGRETSFAPSFRFMTDLGTDHAYTTLAGGASDRPFSRWYTKGLVDWLQCRFKTLSGQPQDASVALSRVPEGQKSAAFTGCSLRENSERDRTS
jgi:penicillin amidase